jgi:hypothetical protein
MIRTICVYLLLASLAACSNEKNTENFSSESLDVSSSQNSESLESERLSLLFDHYWEEYLDRIG